MKIIKQSLNEQIYIILKEDIINNKIKFGSILVNRDLQKRFNVSSTPIRDAILRLKEDGIIESITRSGAKLINFDCNFAIKVNQFIMTLTLGAIEYLSKSDISNEFILQLKNNVYLEEENINTSLYYNYDYKFHKTIFEFCENYLLRDIFEKYNLILQLLARYYHDISYESKNRKKCIEEHIFIVNAIEQRDFQKTLYLIRKHYMEAEIIFKNLSSKEHSKNN